MDPLHREYADPPPHDGGGMTGAPIGLRRQLVPIPRFWAPLLRMAACHVVAVAIVAGAFYGLFTARDFPGSDALTDLASFLLAYLCLPLVSFTANRLDLFFLFMPANSVLYGFLFWGPLYVLRRRAVRRAQAPQ